jgi:hypothetical protein
VSKRDKSTYSYVGIRPGTPTSGQSIDDLTMTEGGVAMLDLVPEFYPGKLTRAIFSAVKILAEKTASHLAG